MSLPLRQEPISDTALIEHFDRAGVETAGSRSVELLAGAPLDDDDIDPRQRQLGRQHQPGRATTRDHNRVLGHRHSATSRLVVLAVCSAHMQSACEYTDCMKLLQIRNVPDDVHRTLKSRAALAGMSLSEYALAELRRAAERPTREEILSRIAARPRTRLRRSPAAAVRSERDSR
jgi:plasmid stability protein